MFHSVDSKLFIELRFSEVTQEELGLAIMKRDNLLEEAKSTNDEPDWVKYRNQRDHVNLLCICLKFFFYQSILITDSRKYSRQAGTTHTSIFTLNW